MPPDAQPRATDTASQPSWMAPVTPVVPDHELLRRIGGGSYGDVWLARTAVGTWRAVKVVFRDRFTDARPYEREFNGIRKFEPLSRSNEAFIDILQIGRNDDQGYFYYVMELADDAAERSDGGLECRSDGEKPANHHSASPILRDPGSYVPKTLSKVLLLRGRLPVSECLELGLTLNLGLGHLHRAGLIHRDIKPSNLIFVGGVPKLADIGLVIETAEARSYVGTEGFIPPEGPNSPQADLYSLGKVLYEAGMGKDRKDFPEPMTQIAEAPDSAALLEFNAILLKACAAKVQERYQSAEEMNADLALLQSGGSVRRQRQLAGQLRFVQRAGAIATVIAALVAAGWWWQARQTRIVRNLADQNRQIAEEKTRLASEKTSLAEANREQLVRLRIANGVRAMDGGDLPASLLWFAEALPLVTNRPAEEEIHRIRIQQVMDQGPRLPEIFGEESGGEAGAFSSDGKLVAAASREGGLRVWDVESGKVLWGPKQLKGLILFLRFTNDRQRLLVSSSSPKLNGTERLVAVLDAQTGREILPALQQFSGIASNMVCSAFSPDDRWLAVTLSNHVIRVLDARDARPVVDLSGHTNKIDRLSFSADGTLLASAGRDLTVRLWRLPSGESVGKPIRLDHSLTWVTLSDDGSRLLTCTRAIDTNSVLRDEWSVIQVWGTQTGARIGDELKETNSVSALTFCPGAGDRFIYGGSSQTTAEVRNSDTKKPVLPPLKMTAPARCWDFSADGKQLVIGSDDGHAYIWSLETGETLHSPLPHNGWVNSVRFSPDGARLLATSQEGPAKVWDLRSRSVEKSLRVQPDLNLFATDGFARVPGPIAVQLGNGTFSLIDPISLKELHQLSPSRTNVQRHWFVAAPDGQAWAMSEGVEDAGKILDIWRQGTNGLRHFTLDHPASVGRIIFSPDSTRLISDCDDRQIRVWRTSDGALEHAFPLAAGLKEVEAFLPDGKRVVVRRDNDERELVEISSQKTLCVFEPLPEAVKPVMDVEPDNCGLRVAVGGRFVCVIYDLGTGKILAPPIAHGGVMSHLDFSPDGGRILTVGYAPPVQIWDAVTGELISGLWRVGANLPRFAFWSADGRFITTRYDGNSACVWDAATAEPVTPNLKHDNLIVMSVVTEGPRLLTATLPNLLRSRELKPTSLPPEIIADYAKLLSGQRLNVSGALLPLKPAELAELYRSLLARAPELFTQP